MTETPGKVQPSRRPKNEAEGLFYDLATQQGWELTRRGWPDYLVKSEGRIIAVEVKPSQGRRLKEEEAIVMDFLSLQGIDCYVWSPDGGFVAVGGKGGRGLGVVESTPNEGGGRQGKEYEEGGQLPLSGLSPERNGTQKAGDDVARVWGCYVEVMAPRSAVPGEDDKRLIRAALKVASAEELCRAINGCFASDYHMKRGRYEIRKGGKYNKLSQIIRGRSGKETTRERIDFFLERLDESGTGGGDVPSADPAIVNRKKLQVQRGWRFRDDPQHHAHAEAKAGKEWLEKHGIETVNRTEDGYPIFRALRREVG